MRVYKETVCVFKIMNSNDNEIKVINKHHTNKLILITYQLRFLMNYHNSLLMDEKVSLHYDNLKYCEKFTVMATANMAL